MNEITEKRTPEIIGAEIRMYVEAGRRITLLCGIEIGRRLTEAKELLAHGEWLPWLERETQISDRSAARYMQIFREYGAAQQSLFGPVANSPTLSNLSITNALRLLAVPEEERESFAEEHDVEHLSAREVEALVKERTAALEAEKEEILRAAQGDREAKEQAENERQAAEKALGMAREKIRDLESQPQAVAVERDEKAIQEAAAAARKAAEAEATKKIKDLEKRISTAQTDMQAAATELERLRGKLTETEKRAAEGVGPYKAQIKELESRLTLASPEVAEFKAAFDRAQGELVKMLDALHKVQDEGVRAKLSEAARAVLTSFEGRV